MKIDKILKEILENNPELNAKEKELKKIIETLIKSNLDIKANAQFKKNLKTKLDTIIGLKTGKVKKINFSYFINYINIFGALFVMFGVYYFISGTTFFHENKDNIPYINNLQNEDEVIPKESIVETQINSIETIDNVQVILKTKNKEELKEIEENINIQNLRNVEKIPEIQNNVTLNDSAIFNDTDNEIIIETNNNTNENDQTIGEINLQPMMFKSQGVPEILEQNNDNIEDTQIIDLLGEPEAVGEYSNDDSVSNFGEIMSDGQLESDMNFDESTNMLKGESLLKSNGGMILESDNDLQTSEQSSEESLIDILEKMVDFEEYCEENLGELISRDGEKTCIVLEKECLETDYSNGACDFSEKK